MVLEGVGRDPVGSFQKDGFSIDAEIETQSRRPDNRVLDEFYRAEIHLQETFSLLLMFNRQSSQTHVKEIIKVTVRLTLVSVLNIETPS